MLVVASLDQHSRLVADFAPVGSSERRFHPFDGVVLQSVAQILLSFWRDRERNVHEQLDLTRHKISDRESCKA